MEIERMLMKLVERVSVTESKIEATAKDMVNLNKSIEHLAKSVDNLNETKYLFVGGFITITAISPILYKLIDHVWK